jgi:hypothetical protein
LVCWCLITEYKAGLALQLDPGRSFDWTVGSSIFETIDSLVYNYEKHQASLGTFALVVAGAMLVTLIITAYKTGLKAAFSGLFL